LLGYAAWGVATLLRAVIPALAKVIREENEKEAKEKAAAAEQSHMKQPSDGVQAGDAQKQCEGGVCYMKPR